MEQPEVRNWMSAPTSLGLVDRKMWQPQGWKVGWAEVLTWAETAKPAELDAVSAAEAALASATGAEIETARRALNLAYYTLDKRFWAAKPPRPRHIRGAGIYVV